MQAKDALVVAVGFVALAFRALSSRELVSYGRNHPVERYALCCRGRAFHAARSKGSLSSKTVAVVRYPFVVQVSIIV